MARTVTVAVHATDDLSGTASLNATLSASGRSVSAPAHLTSGTPLDGTWTASLTIPRWAPQGTWALSLSTAYAIGNSHSYSSTELAAQGLPSGVRLEHVDGTADLFRIQANACRVFQCDPKESVIAIHKGSQEYKSKCHLLSKNLGGRYSSIEEIEGRALFLFVKRFVAATTDQNRLKEVIAFACKCMTQVKVSLSAATVRGEHTAVRNNTRNPDVARAANAFLVDPASVNLFGFLAAIKTIRKVDIFRADLFNRMIGVLRKHMLNPQITLAEAAEKYRAEFRYRGRPVGRRKLIGTTLLVKGLEFDHAIILDAESLSRKELYVAFTRGAKSLTIISSSPFLNPAD